MNFNPSYLRFPEYRCACVAGHVRSLTDLGSFQLPFASAEDVRELFYDAAWVNECAAEEGHFRVRVYRDLHAEEEKWIIGFAGTDPVEPMHWVNNIRQWAGMSAEMYERAVQIVGQLRPERADDVILTGHSLGGGMATIAAMVHRMEAVVFNPPGLHANTLRQYGVSAADGETYVRRFVVEGDLLDLINHIPLTQIEAVGQTQTIYGSTRFFFGDIAILTLLATPTALVVQKGIELHKMSEVVVGMEKWCDSLNVLS